VLLDGWKGTPVRVGVDVEGRPILECEGWLVEATTAAPGVYALAVAASPEFAPTATFSLDHEQYSWARAAERVNPLSVFIQLMEDGAIVEITVHRMIRPPAQTPR
jgi:hypothetical protein